MKKPLVLILIALTLASTAWARNRYLSTFNSQYGTAGTRLDDCAVCHSQGNNRNAFGADFEQAMKASGATVTSALLSIEPLDSDGDGVPNNLEIAAGTFPGDSSDFPSVAVESENWTSVKSKYR